MKILMRIVIVTALGIVLYAGCAPVEEAPPATLPAPTIVPNTISPTKDPGEEKLVFPPPPSNTADPARTRLEAAIKHVRERDLLTTNGFWTIFHGILGLGPGLTLRNPETNQRVNALDAICAGGRIRGALFLQTGHGLDVGMGPLAGGMGVSQGHQDQFIAEMGQWSMPADRTFVINGKEFTFMDFVKHSQARATVKSDQELSWAIIIVGQYVGTDISWTNLLGEKLHYEDMIRYEVNATVEGAACGGTHRLFGLSWAYHLYLQRGGKTEGVWKDVVARSDKYRDLARKYQNADGSLSTSFFKERGNSTDKNLRINSTGHMLEWLALALSDEELRQPWVQDAASALALMILDMQNSPIDGGSLYHAVHGLYLYYTRIYGRSPIVPAELLIPLRPGWKQPEVVK